MLGTNPRGNRMNIAGSEPRRARRIFSDADLERITAAVKEAEGKTAGEIVPCVVQRSDDYEEAVWRGGFLFGIVVFVGFACVRRFTTAWLPVDFATAVLAACVAGGGGMLLVQFIPALKRLFAGSSLIHRRVSQRAAEAFITEEVFNTRDRTGILIFLSLLERKVLVVGDAGINAKVGQQEWKGIVERVVSGMRNGRPAEGLIDAVQQSGVLLQRRGVEIRQDDTDELGNSPRLEDDPQP